MEQPTDLFTIACAATELGVTRQAIEARIEKTQYQVQTIGTFRFVTRAFIDAYRTDRTARAAVLLK